MLLWMVCLSVSPEHRRPQKTSQYKGVSWHKREGKWRAAINLAEGQKKHLGYFTNEEEAARAFDVGAIHFLCVRSKGLNFFYEEYVDEEGNWREEKYPLMIGEEAGPGPMERGSQCPLAELTSCTLMANNVPEYLTCMLQHFNGAFSAGCKLTRMREGRVSCLSALLSDL